jgi:hypothetical protein
MWMTDFVRDVKRQLRDVYGLTPSRVADGEPCFEHVPNGLYLMTIEGKAWHVAVIDDRFHFLEVMKPKAVGAPD